MRSILYFSLVPFLLSDYKVDAGHRTDLQNRFNLNKVAKPPQLNLPTKRNVQPDPSLNLKVIPVLKNQNELQLNKGFDDSPSPNSKLDTKVGFQPDQTSPTKSPIAPLECPLENEKCRYEGITYCLPLQKPCSECWLQPRSPFNRRPYWRCVRPTFNNRCPTNRFILNLTESCQFRNYPRLPPLINPANAKSLLKEM